EEIRTLVDHGCHAEDWTRVLVADPFLPERTRNVRLIGSVKIGVLEGTFAITPGLEKPAGLYNALIANCTIGNGVRVAQIGSHLANYEIGDGACIENVGSLETRPGATFGNGVSIEVLNEGGGRELVLFDDLSSAWAYIVCLYQYRPALIERMAAMAAEAAARAAADRGQIGKGACIASVREMTDVRVGDYAVVRGAARLRNGTILSQADAVTTIGADVQAEDFIIAEGTEVSGAAILNKTYIGQGCRIGRQFSAEGSAFFANCEGFHGEACSLLAGPYTVTHHKSTLLIAGLFSFYNAGSGTNQSNHMYKLGPLHEGKLERGCKTGSFSYMMWPCRVGPFSVVLGKHKGTFDTHDFPFSFLEATAEGRCTMVPGLNLATVGTLRDGAKWPARDRRAPTARRDHISFDVLSPYTVGRMLVGSARLDELQQKTDRSVHTVTLGGAEVKRVLLNSGRKFYRSGIHVYLLEKVVARVERAMEQGATSLSEALATSADAVFSREWVDVGGLLMPHGRLDQLLQHVQQGDIADPPAFHAELDAIQAAYADDEWAWVREIYPQIFDVDLGRVGGDDLRRAAESLLAEQSKLMSRVLADATKEFSDLSRVGFGHDGDQADAQRDFAAVRGEYDDNSFVQEIRDKLEALERRVETFCQAVASLKEG
ncbi:MAG: DUF4954 family protein, partial [Pirellulales bacterium]